MDEDQLRNIIAALPEKLSRSRLEPYRQLIGELRRRRRTYREIADVLAEKCDLRISATAVHNFVRLHLRRKPNRQKSLSAQSTSRREISPTEMRISAPKANDPERKEPAGDREIWQRIAELKRRISPAEEMGKQFHFNSDEPLHLVPNIEGKSDTEL